MTDTVFGKMNVIHAILRDRDTLATRKLLRIDEVTLGKGIEPYSEFTL
jgi:hypothetical protein